VPYTDSAETGRVLLALGGDVNAQTRDTGETPCHLLLRWVIRDAIDRGHRGCLQEGLSLLSVLMAAGADLGRIGTDGCSCARIICYYAWGCKRREFPLDVAEEVRSRYLVDYVEWRIIDGDAEGRA
jgi:hypothetical protein